jgi:hypothetical protein
MKEYVNLKFMLHGDQINRTNDLWSINKVIGSVSMYVRTPSSSKGI